MIFDKETRLASAQALVASGATTDYYDAGTAAVMAHDAREPLAMVFTITTSAQTNSGNETYTFNVETDDNTGFLSSIPLATRAVAAAALVVGAQVVIPIPTGRERYTRGYVALGGTAPTVSFNCDILPLSMARNDNHAIANPSGVTIV